MAHGEVGGGVGKRKQLGQGEMKCLLLSSAPASIPQPIAPTSIKSLPRGFLGHLPRSGNLTEV